MSLIFGSVVRYNVRMNKIFTASEARKEFFSILREIETPGVFITITHAGHPKGVFISFEEFEGWMETMDIMSDPEEVKTIRNAQREKEKGEVVNLEEFRKNLGV